jgi:lipid II:glycine glycyltransferase (peptidoglycan interpeptide bridge formation enzyme)
MARRLDHTTRQSIVKKMREGVRPQVLAREYGVTVRTVYRCAQVMRQIQVERGSRTETLVCRVSPADLALFDQKLQKAGIRNRSEALRNVIRNTNGMAAPDAELADALRDMKAALNKVGNNISQIARQMNRAKNHGQPLPLSEEDHMAIRHLSGMVLDFADEIALMAEGRRNNLELKISGELKKMAERGV